MRLIVLAIIFLLGCSFNVAAQKNYVLNGNFEQYDTCPKVEFDDISRAKYWSGLDSVGFPLYVPEYRNMCSPNLGVCSVPDNGYFFQYPRSGKGFAQVMMYSDGSQYPETLRDYLQGRLYKKLRAGKQYCVSFYVNMEEISLYAISNFSAYFDNGIIDTVKESLRGQPQTKYTPQINYTGPVVKDTLGWTKIEGSFIAAGNEQFITIGDFQDQVGTTAVKLPLNSYNAISWITLYLIDDVSVVESDSKADAGPDTHVGYGDSVYIGLPPSEVIWNSWTALGDPTVIGHGPGIWVKPKTTTYYEVTQTICGNTTKDTVKVEVWAAGVSSPPRASRDPAYSIAPNPNNGHFTLQRSSALHESVAIDVRDVLGRKVLSRNFSLETGRAEVGLDNVVPGMYIVTVYEPTGPYNLRIDVQ